MSEEQIKKITGHLDEISESLISLETFLVESGLKNSLNSIAKSLKKIAENIDK